MGTILFTCNHVGEFEAVSYKIPEISDVSRWYKGRSDHITHKEVAYPFGILSISLVSLLRFCVLGMSKYDIACLFENIEYRDPVFTC